MQLNCIPKRKLSGPETLAVFGQFERETVPPIGPPSQFSGGALWSLDKVVVFTEKPQCAI